MKKFYKSLKKFLFFAAVNSICRLHWKMSQYWIMDNIKLVTFTPHLNAERNSLFPAHVIILTPKKRRERSRQNIALGLNFLENKLQWKRILCDLYFIWEKNRDAWNKITGPIFFKFIYFLNENRYSLF